MVGNSFSEKLKDLRKKQGFTQKEVAEKLGIIRQTYAAYENNISEPDINTINTLATIFGVSKDYLLGNNGENPVPISQSNYEVLKNIKSQAVIKIPLLGYIRAGAPTEAIEIKEYIDVISPVYLHGDYFALTVKGDSMAPRFIEGDIVIVKKQPDVESGEIAVVIVNGFDATLKKVTKHENGISLIPFNHVYEPMFYSKKDIEELPVEILGKVVELRGCF